jgi:hypothetical protein
MGDGMRNMETAQQAATATDRPSDIASSGRLGPYLPIPLDGLVEPTAVRLCVMLRQEKARCYPFVLRETLDSRIFLGGLVDHLGNVGRWLEIHVQHVDELQRAPAAYRQTLTNAILDQRWCDRAEAMAELQPGDLIRTTWERVHPAPMLIDVQKQSTLPLDGLGGWRLCKDDALLERHGLPRYSTTLHRYLVQNADPAGDGANGQARFIPVTADAPKNDHTVPREELWKDAPSVQPFNLSCGLVQVRSFDPVSYERFVDHLSGAMDAPLPRHPGLDAEATGGDSVVATMADEAISTGRLFFARHARTARLLETLHLKLRVFADAVRLIRQYIAQTQTPLLNVRADSFRVRLGPNGTALPFLWTARAVQVEPGEAIRLPTAGASETVHDYFLSGRAGEMSVYSPASANRAMRGTCSIRIRQVRRADDAEVSVEGTFSTHERVQSARGDLIWMRVPIAGVHFDLRATMDADEAMASGEWRFRTGPIRIRHDEEMEILRRAEGTAFEQVEFDLIPMLSSPHDLYAMGVLATRTFLVNQHTTLSKALDEVLSLARRVADDHDPDVGLSLRVYAAFDADARWQESLGPHRLTSGSISPQDAAACVPAETWWDVLAMIVRMFPGVGPDSTCRDFSSVTPGGLARVFDPTIHDLDALLTTTRNFVTYDWQANREIHQVIEQLRNG